MSDKRKPVKPEEKGITLTEEEKEGLITVFDTAIKASGMANGALIPQNVFYFCNKFGIQLSGGK